MESSEGPSSPLAVLETIGPEPPSVGWGGKSEGEVRTVFPSSGGVVLKEDF